MLSTSSIRATPDYQSMLTLQKRRVLAPASLALGAALFVAADAAANVTRLVTKSDAYVSQDTGGNRWTIGNSVIAASFSLGLENQLVLTTLMDPRTERRSALSPGADTAITLDGQPVVLADRPAGLKFADAAADSLGEGVHLAFTYNHAALHLRLVRHYACYPHSPTIETWTQIAVADGAEPVPVSNLTGWQLTVPVGTIHWVNGLRRDAPDTPNDDAFSLGHQDLAPDERLTLSSLWRSSEHFVPFISIEGENETWYGGLQWSGAWEITCVREGSQLLVTASFPDVATTASHDTPLEIPHSFFGVSTDRSTTVTGSLRPFIRAIRQGRPLAPLVTYNTWYSYGIRFDEGTIKNEINQTAALGMELFVLDAGWYPGAGKNGVWDFDTGLGTWKADPDRFPNGLRPLAEFAHDSGMKFGLWVEPARVSLETVGQPGLAQESFLAKRDGRNVSENSGQICFGSRAAWKWVFDQLTRLIDDVQPDYLKWDNNMWLNCNRAGHEHGSKDGNLAQVKGLYAMLEALRDRYPDLRIENVSDGGSRVDFGWLRYSEAAWMDDRTAPAAHVRHILEGLSTVFPPAYLLSFMIDDAAEPFVGADDLTGLVRSRLPGILGFSYKSPGLRPSIAAPFAQAITDYKGMRDILANADAILLSEQQGSPRAVGWDVLEELDADTGNAVLFAFQQPGDDHRVLIHPRGLRTDSTYDVRSLDTGALGSIGGEALMRDGVELVPGDGSRAHVLVFRVE